MDRDQQTELWIERALGEVERDLSLPNNSLVDETPLPKIREGVRLKTMEVQLDQNFMARVPNNLIKHSRELKLRKSCRARRNHLTPHEWDRLTSGEVS